MGTARLRSINPATGEAIRTFSEPEASEIDKALERGCGAFNSWRERPFSERAERTRQAGTYLRQNKASIAALMTTEMGKPIAQSEAEVEKCAWNCDYFAARAEEFLAPETYPSNAESYVQFTPLGTLLAIMPWNFPLWQVFRFAAPALMAGNTAILKHASNVSQCALLIEEIFRSSQFPDASFKSLLLSGETACRVIGDPRIAAVTLTGSDSAGSRVAEAAGRTVKKTVLELGGSDPFIVLKDADVDAAVETGVQARFQNTGQSCIAAKRFIVEESIFAEFEGKFVEAVEKLSIGDPMDRSTQLGPLARGDLRDAVELQVRRSTTQGAKILRGGSRLPGPGFFFQPTVLSKVTPGMPAFDEELFGPVAPLISAKTEDEAIELANNSKYGLGASLWTTDVDRARKMAPRIETGQVFINGMVASDPRLPFGGIKRSGYGRELSNYGIREFVNVQTVWIGPPQN